MIEDTVVKETLKKLLQDRDMLLESLYEANGAIKICEQLLASNKSPALTTDQLGAMLNCKVDGNVTPIK